MPPGIENSLVYSGGFKISRVGGVVTKFVKVVFLHVSVCPRGGTWAGTLPPGQVHPLQVHPLAGTSPQAGTSQGVQILSMWICHWFITLIPNPGSTTNYWTGWWTLYWITIRINWLLFHALGGVCRSFSKWTIKRNFQNEIRLSKLRNHAIKYWIGWCTIHWIIRLTS